ncbi:cytosolic protein [Bacillus massilinigeriensis]|uniref:cytosolic protein n=1 Tax=Bacillus massilionigeriensis TaxID=1805475 RepID=UPI00096B0722|nr:cytosolic protein [Bacillus massilionigeriensis]
MKAFTVNFHQEDQVEAMKINKLSEEDFNQLTEGGTRHLFELDTNIGFFVFFDAIDSHDHESYLVLHYEEDQEEPIGCYSFELKDFYQFCALHLNDLEFQEELDGEEEEEEYSPIHHLAHLMYHIIEEGKEIEA